MTDGLVPRDYLEHAAIVRGASAIILHRFILDHGELWARHTARVLADPSQRAGLTSTMLAIEAAADNHRATIDGSVSDALPPISDAGEWLTVIEASTILNVSDRRVRQLAASGDLPSRRVDGRWRILRSGVAARRAA